MNKTRNDRSARKSKTDLIAIVDAGSLASAAATYWLRQNHGISYHYVRDREVRATMVRG